MSPSIHSSFGLSAVQSCFRHVLASGFIVFRSDRKAITLADWRRRNSLYLFRCRFSFVQGRLLTDEGPTFKCNELIAHVKQHLLDVRDSIQKMLLNDDHLINGQTDEDNPLFKCLWEDCDFVPVRPGEKRNGWLLSSHFCI